MSYKIFRDALGVIDAINDADSGASIPRNGWTGLGIDLSPAPPTIAPPQPDWTTWRQQNLPVLVAIATKTPQAQVLFTVLSGLVWRVGENPELVSEIGAVWQVFASGAQPSPGQLEALRQSAIACNLPAELITLLE